MKAATHRARERLEMPFGVGRHRTRDHQMHIVRQSHPLRPPPRFRQQIQPFVGAHVADEERQPPVEGESPRSTSGGAIHVLRRAEERVIAMGDHRHVTTPAVLPCQFSGYEPGVHDETVYRLIGGGP